MSILITGAGGQIGQELRRRAGTGVLALDRSALDVSQRKDTLAALARLRPRLVINAAAYTAVDQAESEPDAAFAVNRDGAAHLAEGCAELGIPLLHLSTDYVFDGRKNGAYRETDTPNPLGVYARSKWEGEQRVRERLPQHLILRTSWVYGVHGSNFVKTVLRLARERSELRIVADQRGCPTSADAVAATLLALADHHLAAAALPWGTYHYCGTPAASWHGFALAIVENGRAMGLLDQVPRIHAIAAAEAALAAPRPANSVLDCSLAESLGMNRQDWRDGLRDVLRRLKQSRS